MSEAYRRAGVDLEAAAKAVELIRDVAASASRPEVAGGVGGFAGLFDLGDGRLLATATDGVGTKIEVARQARRLDTVGIDVVAMCADDVVCTGAEPLFFLDYLAVGRVVPDDVASIVGGVAEGCRRAGCALLGGETAEHPGVMAEDGFDLAGFCVGLVEERDLLGPQRVHEGDVLIGLPSSGLHSNGFSLVRKALLEDAGYELDDVLPKLGHPLVDELLQPTEIYAGLVLALARDGMVGAAAHITGGGFVENIPRALPEGLGAQVDRGSWIVPPIFDLLREVGNSSEADMFSTFNMGIGMVLVVSAGRRQGVLELADGASVIGRVTSGEGVSFVG